MSMIETYYRILKHDEKGKLVKDTGLLKSHSYVIQFLEMMYALYNYEGITTIVNATDVTGTERQMFQGNAADTQQNRIDAPINNDTYGTVVGTNNGATPESNTDYNLDTKILDSTVGEAGKLNYRANTFTAPHELAGNIDFDISRPFINETGSTITVKEIGIIMKQSITGPYYHLILRDVVADEDVLDGYTLTVVYTLRTTV